MKKNGKNVKRLTAILQPEEKNEKLKIYENMKENENKSLI